MKNLLLTSAVVIAALPALAQSAPTSAAVNLIAEGRHMPVLNEQTFGDAPYIVPAAPEGSTQFAFTLKGYVFGIRLIKATYLGYETDTEYAAYTDMKTSGLAALLQKLDIWAVTRGTIGANGSLRPDFHVQQNTDKKNRRVEMNYDNAARSVDVNIIPRLGSQGVPPASPEERFAAYDTVTALMEMMRKGRQDAASLCQGSVPIFDSKQHYNLRLAPVGTASVKFLDDKDKAIHCYAYYEPVSGFDAEDLPDVEEAGTPVDIYFKYYPEVDMHVPVRFAYRISSFKAIIKMTGMIFVTPEGEVITAEN
ncbi:MAG: DUF3108 domain-containing protein [Litorimonas sp.]